MASRTVIIAGATGLVGREILAELLEDRTVAESLLALLCMNGRPTTCIQPFG